MNLHDLLKSTIFEQRDLQMAGSLNGAIPEPLLFFFFFLKKKSKIYSAVLGCSLHARYPKIQSATPYV